MDHHRDRLSAEEILMIFCLLLSTSLMLICFNMKLRPHLVPEIKRSDFSAVPRSTSATLPSAHTGPSANAGSSNANGPASIPDASADNRVPPPSEVIARRNERGDVVAMITSPNYASNQTFGSAELSSASDNNRRSRSKDIRVVKDIYVDGKRVGALEITVSAADELFVYGRELKVLLSRPEFESRGFFTGTLENGPINFQTLKARGIDLQYSPEDDVFKING